MKYPRVTVLLPVYNAATHLRQALDSLLAQTHRDFELLVIDDGSTDDSVNILLSTHDSRINLLKNDRNRGLIYTLNRGLGEASGRFLMRMDADDVAMPRRIEKQLQFMLRNPAIGISGTWSRTFGAVKASWETRFPKKHNEIVAQMIFNTALSHPTAMMDLKLMRDHGLRYSENAMHAEDYDLWVRASEHFRLANVPEVLLHYRVHEKQVSKQFSEGQQRTANEIRLRLLKRLGVRISPAERMLHFQLSSYAWPQTESFFCESRRWLQRLTKQVGEANPEFGVALRKVCVCRLRELHHYVHKGQRKLERATLYFTL